MLLALSAIVSAAGIAEAGISQATPHAAGALAVVRAAVPTYSPDRALARLVASGKPVTGARVRRCTAEHFRCAPAARLAQRQIANRDA